MGSRSRVARCQEEEAREKKREERLSVERARIDEIADEKADAKERLREELSDAGIEDAEREERDLEERGLLSRVYGDDVEWPGLYGSTTLPGVGPRMPRRGKESALALLAAKCRAPVSLEELVGYVNARAPTHLAWGDVPRRGELAIGWHATRIVTRSGLVLYRAWQTRLYEPRKKRAPRKPGDKPRRRLQVFSAPPPEERAYETDTAENLLSGSYEPGMVLDPTTLITVLARRRRCIESHRRFSETTSYRFFEEWVAAALEIRDPPALAYVAGILGGTRKAGESYATCIADGLGECEDELLGLLSRIRRAHWAE